MQGLRESSSGDRDPRIHSIFSQLALLRARLNRQLLLNVTLACAATVIGSAGLFMLAAIYLPVRAFAIAALVLTLGALGDDYKSGALGGPASRAQRPAGNACRDGASGGASTAVVFSCGRRFGATGALRAVENRSLDNTPLASRFAPCLFARGASRAGAQAQACPGFSRPCRAKAPYACADCAGLAQHAWKLDQRE